MGVKGFDETARWFAGKGRAIADVSAVGAAGGLGLHEVRYRDGGRERYLDVADDFAWPPLLDRLRRGGPIGGDGGRLELRPGPALGNLVDAPGPAHVPATDSRTRSSSSATGCSSRPTAASSPGRIPRSRSSRARRLHAPVPGFGGSVHWVDDAGENTAIALLQAFVPGAEDGWEARWRGSAPRSAPAPYPMAEWETAGATTAALHLALARAFPSAAGARRTSTAGATSGRRPRGHRPERPRGRGDHPRRARAARDPRPPRPAAVTRIHGDLHVAQMLRAGGAVLVIDFEGDPIRPLADRRRPATPLYDLAACCARSTTSPAPPPRRTPPAPDAWIAEACAATAAAYEAGTGTPLDRDLLAALELVKECTEFVYAARFLPGWIYAPRNGMRRLLERPVAIG
jgi:hypothetical protein